jgi:endonuclease/exonuclease/phosphatase family metal-dependent hydrolase
MSFRVLQFNMQFGQLWRDADPDNAPIDLEQSIAEIKSHAADIILLQEVERALPGGVQPDIPPNYTRLKQALPGYDSYFSYPDPDPRELPFGIGLAIFSRTPLSETRRVVIPSPPVEFDFLGEKKTPTDRLLIGARTRIEGREVCIMNTHLLAFFMLNTSSLVHTEQRQLVLKELHRCHGPTILTGDFNVRRHESLVGQFGEAGFRTVQDKEVTWRRRPYVLDHIFYNASLRVLNHQVKATPASDHHALVAELEFVD